MAKGLGGDRIYQGLCLRYGRGSVLAAGLSGPPLLSLALDFFRAAQGASRALEMAPTHAVLAWGAGMAGAVCAVWAYHKAGEHVTGQKHGISRGSHLVRRAQIAAWAVPVGLALCFNAFGAEGEDLSENRPVRDSAIEISFPQV